MKTSQDKCFACGRQLNTCCLVDTRDGQEVFVGKECYRKIMAAGDAGYQPPQGGPKLYPIREVTADDIRNCPDCIKGTHHTIQFCEPHKELIKVATANKIEQRALAIANNRTALRKRLNEARSVLTNPRQFGRGKFDFEKKRLIGDNGLALQWLLRPEPDQPPSYRNQQTNQGTVIVTCPQ